MRVIKYERPSSPTHAFVGVAGQLGEVGRGSEKAAESNGGFRGPVSRKEWMLGSQRSRSDPFPRPGLGEPLSGGPKLTAHRPL